MIIETRRLHTTMNAKIMLYINHLCDQIENVIGGACSTYGERRVTDRLWWGNLRDRDHSENPGVDGRIILRWSFRKWDAGGHGLDKSSSGQGQAACSCKRGNEPSGSIKCGGFLTG
jgi:hypothetical protein